MKLIISYKGINKTMLNFETYDDVVKFVHQNFFLKMSKWNMCYIDSDGDSISLDSDMDLKIMLETCGKDNIKIYVKDIDLTQDQKQFGQHINIDTLNQTSKIANVEAEKTEEKKIQETKQQAQITQSCPENKNIVEKKQEAPMGKQFDRCGGRQMWKKKMEEKMAKFVDERIESLLPYITKKVEQKMANKIQKQNKVVVNQSLINHKVKCNICGQSEIVGIRYKCVKCPLFNLCQNCEATGGHKHNMIKMKFLEELQAPKFEEPWKPLWKKEQNQGVAFPPPPFGSMPGPFGPFGHMAGKYGPMPGLIPGPFPFGPTGVHPPHFSFDPNIPKREEKNQKSCDKRLKLTKKCFRMAEVYGGQPKSYQEFVNKNLDLKFDQLSSLYKVMNQNVKVQQVDKQKVLRKAEKLSFYFQQPVENYLTIVENNPALCLKQLLSKVSEGKSKSKIPIVAESEKKTEKVHTFIVPPPAPPMAPHPLLKKPMDIQKRNSCILEMKELFGQDKVYDYINFFNDHWEEQNHVIIEKYIEKLTKQ